MGVTVVYETHSTSEDNETGIMTGWLPGRLSALGRTQAEELGARRRGTVDAVFSSDLGRAVETMRIAFDDTLPVFLDWRLRECDYGELNGTPRLRLPVDERYPGIGHVATRWALDHRVRGVPLEQLWDEDFAWQPGWEYELSA